MAVQEYKIEVFRRDLGNKSALKQLRREGFVPGIYYADDQKEPIPFKVETKELHQALSSDALVYHVSVGGKRRNVVIKEIQYHPVSDEILHLDFKGIRMDEEIEVHVPVHLLGRPIGVKDEGGQLHQGMTEIAIRCLASDIPPHIELDISDLHLGQTIHAGELELEGVELVTNADAVVVTVHRARIAEIEEVVEEEEEFEFEEEAKAEEAEESEEEPEKEQE